MSAKKQINIRYAGSSSDYLPCTEEEQEQEQPHSSTYSHTLCMCVHYCARNGTDSAPCTESRKRPSVCQREVEVTSGSSKGSGRVLSRDFSRKCKFRGVGCICSVSCYRTELTTYLARTH